jgi:hypothetical protein
MIFFWICGTRSGGISTPRSPREQQVVTRANEAHRHPVHAERRAERHVLDVLVGQCGDREVGVGDVDPLVVRQHATRDHLGDDGAAIDPFDSQRQPTVVEQQRVAGLDVVAQARIGDADARLVARCVVVAGERERRAGGEGHLAVGEARYADLRTLQVLQDSEGTPARVRDGADACHVRLVDLALAVREVQPEDVDARVDEVVDAPLVAGRGTERGDDLGAAWCGAHDRKALRPR